MTAPIYQNPVALLQKLIQFDTTNPPGNEAACIAYIRQRLADVGIESQLFAMSPERPNLVARLRGRGDAPPLLLYGHVDVVTTEDQQWQHPPFAGKIVDGELWGRGSLDMKGGVAMMLAAFMRAKVEALPLPGDVVLTILSDEEAGGDLGAKFMVERHPEQFEGIRYALGEFGGFTLHIGKHCFYPIQVAEKQLCWMKATIRSRGGHGSFPVRDGAMAQLGQLLQQINKQRLPVHITPVARQMFDIMATTIGGPSGLLLRQLTNPRLTDLILNFVGERLRIFDPLLHNTVSPTILHGGSKINVIPAEVSVELDGRLLPGYTPDDMMAELRQIIGNNVELEVDRYDPSPTEPNMALFDTLAGILREADPEGIPVPLLLSGVSDARFFSQLGIQSYGFIPMKLPKEFKLTELIHAANERIPVEAVDFGTEAIYKALERFGA